MISPINIAKEVKLVELYQLVGYLYNEVLPGNKSNPSHSKEIFKGDRFFLRMKLAISVCLYGDTRFY